MAAALQGPETQISLHEIRVYEAVRRHTGWLTAREIAVAADVADRTSRHHAGRLGEAGVFEVGKVFGGYRYRIASHQTDGGKLHLAALEEAKRIFGV